MSSRRGKATIFGIDGSISGYIVIWDTQQISQNVKITDVSDGDGADVASAATNEYMEFKADFKPSGTGLANAKANCFLIAPLSIVTVSGITTGPQSVSGSEDRGFNGNWQYRGNGTISMKAGDNATISLTLRKYVNVTQNQLMTTVTPS